MNKIATIFLVLICISSLVFVFFSKREQAAEIKAYQSFLSKMKKENPIPNFYKLSNSITFKYNDSKLPKDAVLLTTDGKEITLQKLQEKEGKLIIFSFSERNCDLCTENELKKIKIAYENKVPYASKIAVISNYNEPHSLEIFKKRIDFNFEIYNSTDVQFLEELGKPFYCVLDQDFKCKDLFVPTKEMPNITEVYFNLMFEKHFN